MISLINNLKAQHMLDQKVAKYTLLINENMESQGALFFIPDGKRVCKVLIPAPYHEELFAAESIPTHKEVVQHKEAMLLK